MFLAAFAAGIRDHYKWLKPGETETLKDLGVVLEITISDWNM